MKNIFFFLFLFTQSFFVTSQVLYDSQVSYDLPGGLFDEDSLREIYLDFYDADYHTVLVDSWFYNPSYRIPARLTLNGILHDSVGVRYKGNSTFCLPNDASSPKVPFNIDMNYFVGGQKLLSYKKIKLANAWMDPTFVKQIIASNIYRKYLPTGESNLVKLYVQGDYNGLYINDESINKQFLEKHFNEKSGPLFKCDNIDRFCDTANAPSAMSPNLYYMGDDSTLYYNSYDMKSDNGWGKLISLIKTINLDFQNLDSILNIDRTLWAFAANQVILNLDCYNTYYVHNYYLYQTKDGLFQMIPWDLDNSFVGAIMGWDYWNPSNVYEFDPYFTGPIGGTTQPPFDERPLLYKLLNDPFYRKIYTAHLRTIINESLDASLITANINQLQSLAYSAASQDPYKAFSMNDYYNNVNNAIWTGWGFGGIISSVNARKQFLLSHPEINYSAPVAYGMNVTNNLATVNVANASSVDFMVTTSEYNSKFQSFQMLDNGTNGDVTANDGVYTFDLSLIQSGSLELKFYIRAQNADAISLLPERAEYEFFTYSFISGVVDNLFTKRRLLKITDFHGRELNKLKDYYNIPLLYIYDDGYVEKKLSIK